MPLTKVPNGPLPKVKGSKHPILTDVVLVVPDSAPKHRQFPRMKSRFDTTLFCVNTKEQRVVQLSTILPGGTHIGWCECGGCHRYFTQCVCLDGVTEPASVVYLYNKGDAMHNHGIPFDKVAEWLRNRTIYDPTVPTDEPKRKPLSKTARKPSKASAAPSGTSTAPKPRKALSKPSAVSQATTTPDELDGVDLANIDLMELTDIANTLVESDDVFSEDKPTKKPLRKTRR